MGQHWHVDGTQLPRNGAALASRWHIIAYQWAAMASHWDAFAQPRGSIGKLFAHVYPAMGSQVKSLESFSATLCSYMENIGQPCALFGYFALIFGIHLCILFGHLVIVVHCVTHYCYV